MPQGQRNVAIMVVCWGWFSLWGTKCNCFSWLFIHELLNSVEEDESAQPELNDQEILDAGQEMEGKEEAAAEEEAVTDRFTTSKKINILGSACTLHYLSQETHRSS